MSETRSKRRLTDCDHNCVPVSKWFRTGWVCVRCNTWFKTNPVQERPRGYDAEVYRAWNAFSADVSIGVGDLSTRGATMSEIKVWTYFGDSSNMLEDQVQNLIDRGGKVISLAIGYGPSPAKVAGLSHGGDAWHALVVVDPSEIDPDA